MIIMKFGGTSVGGIEAMKKVAAIVVSNKEKQPIVVTSAMSGVTDELLVLAKLASGGVHVELETRFAKLVAQHKEVVNSLDQGMVERVNTRLQDIFSELRRVLDGIELLREISPRSLDLVASCGERLAVHLLSGVLNASGILSAAVDSRDGIITDDAYTSAEVDFAATNERLRALLLPAVRDGMVPVITGFIARSRDGATTTLGRGGSDYTAAIVGAALNAEEIQIWTDVDGILSADPRIVSGAKILREVTYVEAVEMSYFGAKVIHPKTMVPAFEANIPIVIKNTFRPAVDGTRIQKEIRNGATGVKVVTAIPKVSMITISGLGLRGRAGFAAKVFEVASRERVNILMITQASSEQSICMIVDRADGIRFKSALGRAFTRELESKNVESIILDENVAIVAAVGAGMRGVPGIAGKTFSATAEAGVNVLAIAQGSSELNISLVIRAHDMEAAVRAIHAKFIS